MELNISIMAKVAPNVSETVVERK